jgi:hypothetical protein
LIVNRNATKSDAAWCERAGGSENTCRMLGLASLSPAFGSFLLLTERNNDMFISVTEG